MNGRAGDEAGVTVWIDATRPAAGLRLFGMTLLERSLRGLLQAGVAPALVHVEETPGRSLEGLVPADLVAALPLRFAKAERPARDSLASLLDAGGPVLALEGDAVLDTRLLAHVATSDAPVVACGGRGPEETAVARLDCVPDAPPVAGTEPEDLPALARRCVEAGLARALPPGEVDDYVPKLRRHLTASGFRVPDARARDAAAHQMFWANYKGSTDFFTRYVYPPLVWPSVRWLASRRIHPNWISAFNVAITFGAIPLFAAGLWLPGLILAWTMSVLDSVDGKLARLTFTSSTLGHVLDHGLDVVHPPMWYLAWAWALGGADASAPVFVATVWMTGAYIVDRIVTQIFTWTTQRSIHAYAPLDVKARTFISRRNINLPIFTVGLIFGLGVEAMLLIVAWQIATLVFHTVRLVQVLSERRRAAAG